MTGHGKAALAVGACALVAAGVAGVALGGNGGQSAQPAPSPAPETIVFNGRITTMDARGSTVQALAIRGGEIVAAGRDADVRALRGRTTRSIDLGGRRVLPGLIDAHLHGVRAGTLGCFSRSPRFDALFTRREALLDVADRAQRTPAGRWLFQPGRGWNVSQLDVPGMLTRAELDAIAPSHPVFLQGAGLPGGGGQLNSLGLRRLNLAAGRPGVVLDARGKPSGQVVGAAAERATRAIARELSKLDPAERDACTAQLIRELNRRGLTAWDDPGGREPRDYRSVARLHRAGALDARIRLNEGCRGVRCVAARVAGRLGEVGDASLRIGGVGEEVLAQGADGVHPPARYRRILALLAAGSWTLEQSATRTPTQQAAIARWEEVNRLHPIADLRWRMLHPGGGPIEPSVDLLARLKDLNAGVVPTGVSVTGGDAHPPYRRIHASGTPACLGSDGLEAGPYAPFVHLWYAVSGRTAVPGQGGVAPEQRLTREQALELATRRCGWFLGLEDRIGSLEPGKLADLVVLEADYFRVPVDELRTLTSVLTMVGGEVVFAAGGYAGLER